MIRLFSILAVFMLSACKPVALEGSAKTKSETQTHTKPVSNEPAASVKMAELAPKISYAMFLEAVAAKPKTSDVLFTYLDKDMVNYWDETTWDFNGTSRTPGEGEIACGYFVTTLLKDLGFKIDRIRLAQEPSGVMIEELTVDIKKSNSLHQTLEGIRKGPKNAIYIIGLDFHTGFISHSDAGTFFIHSDYNERRGVVREHAASSLALSQSGFFMIGNLTDSEAFLERWN